jgi:uncharacterized membrane protein YkgB
MNTLINTSLNPVITSRGRSGLLAGDLDCHIVRALMVILFFFFGYQKWWTYEAERIVPFISNGPLIWWLCPVFGHQGASWFLGAAEWSFGSLLFAGFWDKRLGILGAPVRPRPSSQPSRLFPSCRMVGTGRPDFRR